MAEKSYTVLQEPGSWALGLHGWRECGVELFLFLKRYGQVERRSFSSFPGPTPVSPDMPISKEIKTWVG